MKQEVLSALLTARTLFDAARLQCFVRDRYVASAGLIVLQDALELVLYSCLLEIGADEHKSIESFSFDQLLGEFKTHHLTIPKIGTLKAMNKQRVLIKHHAQLAEPAAVQNYYDASLLAANQLLAAIVGKQLQQIVISDAISNPELKILIDEATQAIASKNYLDAMIAIRKALFLAVESAYDIREWDSTPLAALRSFGNKSPHFTRNRQWIQQNVRKPTDYIQLDFATVRVEMLELGIDPEEFFNVWRLTPPVYKIAAEQWGVEVQPVHEASATEDNARYCLDVVVSVLTKQQFRKGIVRIRRARSQTVQLLRDEPLLETASVDSERQPVTLLNNSVYQIRCIVSGMDGRGRFVQVIHADGKNLYSGFVPVEACRILEAS